MATIRARVTVREDGTIEGNVRGEVPPGEHEVLIIVQAEQSERRFTWDDFPKHDVPWDDSVSLRREDMYGDDGR